MLEGPIPLPVQAATPEALAPVARLLPEGELSGLSWLPGTLVPSGSALGPDVVVEDLQRLPEAERLLQGDGEAGFVLVLIRDDRPEAWRIPPGQAVVISRGTWHADPLALEDGRVLDAIETLGEFDRIDRSSLMALARMLAVRPVLPPPRPPSTGASTLREASSSWQPSPRGPRFTETLPDLVVHDDLVDRVQVGLVGIDNPGLGAVPPPLATFFQGWRKTHDEPGVRQIERRARTFARAIRLPDVNQTPRQQILRGAQQGLWPEREWEGGLWRASLEQGIDLIALAAEDLSPPFALRRGGDQEQVTLSTGHAVRLDRVLVLADAQGPVATLAGPLGRGALGLRTTRAYVFAFLSVALRRVEAEARLRALAAAVPGNLAGVRLFP